MEKLAIAGLAILCLCALFGASGPWAAMLALTCIAVIVLAN